MSYARWGKSSDVYVYPHYAGFVECCGCWLNGGESVSLRSADEVVEHMRAHEVAGHVVPEHLFDAALYPPDDFVAMCDSYMCRQRTGHDGEHSPHRWNDPYPLTSPASNAYRCPCGEPKESPRHTSHVRATKAGEA